MTTLYNNMALRHLHVFTLKPGNIDRASLSQLSHPLSHCVSQKNSDKHLHPEGPRPPGRRERQLGQARSSNLSPTRSSGGPASPWPSRATARAGAVQQPKLHATSGRSRSINSPSSPENHRTILSFHARRAWTTAISYPA